MLSLSSSTAMLAAVAAPVHRYFFRCLLDMILDLDQVLPSLGENYWLARDWACCRTGGILGCFYLLVLVAICRKSGYWMRHCVCGVGEFL